MAPTANAFATCVADRIEADLALLDALDGDTDLEAENKHGGDVQDEPHDAEEDGDAHEIGASVAGFDGTNYLTFRRESEVMRARANWGVRV